MVKKLSERLKKKKRGFTLIELIVVIAILGILAAVLVPTVSNQVSKAKTAAGKSDAQAAFMAAQLYVADETPGISGGTYTDEAADPIKSMEDSKEFATLKANKDFSITKLVVDTDGNPISITISSSSGSGLTYPTSSTPTT